MRWRTVVWLAVVAAVAGFVGAGLYWTAAREPVFWACGTQIIRTTGTGEQVGKAVHRTAWTLGNLKDLGDGRKQFESFSQSAQVWREEAGAEIASRATTSFEDFKGRRCRIEVVTIEGEATLLLLTVEGQGGTMDLMNELMHQLREGGVRQQE